MFLNKDWGIGVGASHSVGIGEEHAGNRIARKANRCLEQEKWKGTPNQVEVLRMSGLLFGM
jgi:hypothetical protein